jgi:myo-inositol 2-dehydrogenase / D-chiro-inositol 1-dehydrogenase
MTIRIGWIGCGRHANEMLLPQLVRYPVQLAALCDVSSERLAETTARYGVTQAFTDAAALIAAPGLDAIGMAVGPAQHEAFAIAALKRGLPVFLEKPPAADVSGAERIARTAAAARKPVIVGFMKRYSSANRIAANVLNGAFGKRLGILAEYMTAPTYFTGNPDYSGFYLHHCVHYMDLAPWLMASPVVALRTRRIEHEPGKLLLHVDLEFASKAIGTLVMGTIQARSTPMEWVQVMGDHKRVEMRNVHEVRYYRAPAFKVSDPQATLAGDADTLSWEPNLTVAANEDHKGYHGLLGAFLSAIEGRPNDAPTIADGARAMRVLEAMIRSGENGERVTLAG